MHRTLGSLALLLALTFASACGGTSGGEVSDNAPTGTNTSKAQDKSSAPAEPSNPKFGQTFTTKSGLSVTVSRSTAFRPGEYAAMTKKWPAYRSFTVTLVNKAASTYDPAGFSTTMQSSDQEAEEVFDSENGFDGSPSTSLLPGRQAKFKIGYGVASPDDMVMDVNLNDEDFNSVTFVNN